MAKSVLLKENWGKRIQVSFDRCDALGKLCGIYGNSKEKLDWNRRVNSCKEDLILS